MWTSRRWMFKKSRKPEGPAQKAAMNTGCPVDAVHVEEVLCRRLAGELLANALFVADARLAETRTHDLPPATQQAVTMARKAIAHAARSGLVLLTAVNPQLEPHDEIDVAKRIRLAATMLRQIETNCPTVRVFEGVESTVARLPVGFPGRLLVRGIGCFPTARSLQVQVDRGTDRGLDSIEIEFRADVDLFDGWIPRLSELLTLVGGSLKTSQQSFRVSMPATVQVALDRDVGHAFIESRRKRTDLPPGK